ncbi:sigma-54-dependent Fis family transcriptional regulator [Methylobacterium sp.]|uniref:sigma-54-dependent Fis family transcriptional regulator n=1 Tax=Methylobacterium sp. TaxID=409 RepID=UPI0025E662C0|nr:sigma-54-dependent Fis family transcriptional regulator [Methylobacterium sp.]
MDAEALLSARRLSFASPRDVPPPILRSWLRCAEAGLDSAARPTVEPMPDDVLRQVVERNEELRRLCRSEIEALHADARATGGIAILTDAEGVILDSLGNADFAARATQVALRPGVPWSEAMTGTNAIGTALIERRAVEVHGPEHYFQGHHILSCAAMPILDPRGGLKGVLDLSSPASRHPSHALGLLRLAVDGIEHRAFDQGFRGCEVVRLHADPALVGTPREGVLVFDGRRLVAANRHGLRLLDLDWGSLDHLALSALFPDAIRIDEAATLRDRAGRSFHVRIERERAALTRVPQRTEPPAPARVVPAPKVVFSEETSTAVSRSARLIDAGVSVLVQGETGTGKEVFARAAHAASARAGRPFVAVNCAALPESLIEAELFGYEAGAFTGARKAGAKGLLREAEGGLLFLDEIGDMPLSLQSRLLRVLQEREVIPVGASRPVALNVAVICATHRSLPSLVETGAFRADLYFRIAGYTVALPALRENGDRLGLVRTLWHGLAPGDVKLSEDCEAQLAACDWPGNFRQLVGTLRALRALAEPGETLTAHALPADLRLPPRQAAKPARGELDVIAREAMRAALAASGGNVSQAARRLGISRSTLYRRCLSAGIGET